jgi:hypothetical protein
MEGQKDAGLAEREVKRLIKAFSLKQEQIHRQTLTGPLEQFTVTRQQSVQGQADVRWNGQQAVRI